MMRLPHVTDDMKKKTLKRTHENRFFQFYGTENRKMQNLMCRHRYTRVNHARIHSRTHTHKLQRRRKTYDE